MRPGRVGFRGKAAATLVAVAITVAGCSGFGHPKPEAPPLEPNAYPADYRSQITAFLRQSLMDRADFRGALIAPPVLKPVGDSQHYVACVQVGHGQLKTKAAIYLQGKMTQFIDAAAGQCDGSAYEPFKELEAAVPPQ